MVLSDGPLCNTTMGVFYMLHFYVNAGSLSIGSQNSGRILLLHEPGSMIGCTCQPSAILPQLVIYLAVPPYTSFFPPPPPPLLIRSLLLTCQKVRHRLVMGEPLGRGTLILGSQTLSFIRPPSRSYTHAHTHTKEDT